MTKIRQLPLWQRTLYVMFVAQLMTAVGFSTIHPFLPLYVDALYSQLGLSVELLSALVFSGQALAMMLASPVWGSLADRYGRKLMVQRSMFGGAFTIILMAFVTSAEQLVVLQIIQGLIAGTLSAANALVASVTPRERSGYAMGLLQTSLFGGIAVGPLLGGLVSDLLGYRQAFVLTAILLALSGVIVWIGVKEHLVPEPVPGTDSGTLFEGWRQILAVPGVKIAYTLRFLTSFAQSFVWPFIPLYILSLLAFTDSVNTYTGLVIGLASVMSTITALHLGQLGDRVGQRLVFMSAATLTGLFYVFQATVAEAWQLFILQLVAGAAFGGIIPTVSALLARYSRQEMAGSVYGLDNSVSAAARTVAPLTAAALAHWLGLRSVFIGTGILFLVAGLAALRWLPGNVRADTISKCEA